MHLSYAWLALPQFIGACSPKEKSLSYQLQEPAALFSYIALAERTAAPFTFIFLSLREQEVNRSAAFLSPLLTAVENSNIYMCNTIHTTSLCVTVKYDQRHRTIVKNIYVITPCIPKGLDIEGMSLGACSLLSSQVSDFNLGCVYTIILLSEELKK